MTQPVILCADDDRNLTRILDQALRGEGFAVEVVHDGEEALARIEDDEPPALVISSWMLPRLDGFSLLERMREQDATRRVPMILTSPSRVTPADKQRAKSLRAQALMAKPVPLDRLMRCVKKYVKPGPPRAVESAQPEAIQGELAETTLPELLHQLHGLRASGVLLLANGKKRKALQMRDGYPVSVKSNLRRECLGDLLVRRGKLSRAQLDESTTRLERGEGLQGAILIAMELMDEGELADALRDQAREKLFEAFTWSEGRYRFDIGKRIERANTLALNGSPASLILDGARNWLPLARIDAEYRRWSTRRLVRSQRDFHRLQDVEFGKAELALLARLEEERPVTEIAELDETSRRAVYGLVLSGLVELRLDPNASRSEPRRVKLRRPVEEKSWVREPQAPEHISGANGASGSGLPSSAAPHDPAREHALRGEIAALAEELERRSLFEIFGVEEDASPLQVKARFDDILKRIHPDRFRKASGAVKELAEDVIGRLEEALEILQDPRRRLEYLLSLKQGARKAAREQEGQLALEAETSFQRGEALMRERRYQMALAKFGEAIERNPEEGEYHAHYGWCLHLCHPDDAGMTGEAIEHVRRGAKLARDHEKPYLFLGRLYKAVGRNPAAEKMFTRAMQIRPDCVEAMRELRLINLRRQKSKSLIGRMLRR